MKTPLIKSTAYFFIVLMLFTSCMSVPRVQNSAAHFSSYSGERSTEFYVFTEGEVTNFKYRKLALVEALGTVYSSDSEVMSNLQYKSWAMGANAILQVKKSQKLRDSGECDLNGNKIFDTVISYEGLAVRVDITREFKENHGSGVGTSFISHYKAQEVSNQEAERSSGVIMVFVALVAGIFIMAQSDEEQ